MKVNTKLTAALSGAVVALLALSACGGDDTGKKQDAWAKGVCDQAGAQLAKIDAANTSLSSVDSAGKPADVKKSDSAAFQSNSDAYKALAGIVGKAGAAPGDDGAKFQQNAVTVFNQLSSQYAALNKQVDGLDSGDQAKFAGGLADVLTQLGTTTSAGTKSLATLRQGDMGKALAKQKGCQQVAGGNGTGSTGSTGTGSTGGTGTSGGSTPTSGSGSSSTPTGKSTGGSSSSPTGKSTGSSSSTPTGKSTGPSLGG